MDFNKSPFTFTSELYVNRVVKVIELFLVFLHNGQWPKQAEEIGIATRAGSRVNWQNKCFWACGLGSWFTPNGGIISQFRGLFKSVVCNGP